MNETITWTSTSTKPDDGQTVLVLLPPAAGEPSWLGWFDSALNQWRDINGSIFKLTPTHLADLPEGV